MTVCVPEVPNAKGERFTFFFVMQVKCRNSCKNILDFENKEWV